jgi:hypothetical protein
VPTNHFDEPVAARYDEKHVSVWEKPVPAASPPTSHRL